MGVLNSVYVRTANDVVHDIGASVAMAFPIASAIVRRAGLDAPAESAELAFSRIALTLIAVAAAALVVIVATGGVRIRYASLGIRSNYVPVRARAALIKHAVFVTVVTTGLLAALRI